MLVLNSSRYVYMDDPVLNLADITTYDLPSMQRIVSLLTTWALTFGIVCVCYYNHRKVTFNRIRLN